MKLYEQSGRSSPQMEKVTPGVRPLIVITQSTPVCLHIRSFNLCMLWVKRIVLAIAAVVVLVRRVMSVPLTGTLHSS